MIGDLVRRTGAHARLDKAVELLLELEKIAPNRKREESTPRSPRSGPRADEDDQAWSGPEAVEISNSKDRRVERLAERYVDMQRIADAIASYERVIELDRDYKATFALAALYIQYEPGQPRRRPLPPHPQGLDRRRDRSTAGRASIDLEEMTGTLGDLEKVRSRPVASLAHKPVYRKILVELYLRYVHVWSTRLRHGDARGAARRRARELDRLGQHGLKPLLEALNDDKDVTQQRGRGRGARPPRQPRRRGAAGPARRATKPRSTTRSRRIGTLRQSLDWEVRVEALVAAGRLGDSGAARPQVLALAKHDEVAMREAAVFTIGRTRDRARSRR